MIKLVQTNLRRWGAWSQQSVNRRIFAATLTVGFFTAMVNLASMLREIVVAHQFGVGNVLDAFLIAFLLPSLVVNIVTGSLNAALVPTYVRLREHEGQDAARRLFSSAVTLVVTSLIILAVLLGLLAPYILPLLASGFGAEKLALTRALFYLLLPALVISGLSTMWRAILNAGERFALGAVAPIMTPIMAIVGLVALGKTWGIYAFAVGTLAGFILEAALLGMSLRGKGLSLVPRWNGMDSDLWQVVNQCAPIVVGTLFMSSTLLVDQAMAATLGAGSISALSYGTKVVSVFTAIGTLALGTAVLPHFSRMIAVGDTMGIRHTLRTYTRLILLTTVPLILVLAYFSEPLVSILFQRGAFTVEDTQLVGQVQALLLLQVPFLLISMIGVRLLSAMGQNRTLMLVNIFNLIADVVGNYVLMRLFGILGIALATSVFFALSAGIIFLIVYRKLNKGEVLR